METINELCQTYDMNIKQISDYFGIPYRTVQDWHAGKRTPPDYVVRMMKEILASKNK